MFYKTPSQMQRLIGVNWNIKRQTAYKTVWKMCMWGLWKCPAAYQQFQPLRGRGRRVPSLRPALATQWSSVLKWKQNPNPKHKIQIVSLFPPSTNRKPHLHVSDVVTVVCLFYLSQFILPNTCKFAYSNYILETQHPLKSYMLKIQSLPIVL